MKLTFWSIVGCVALFATLNCQAGAKVEEQVLGPKIDAGSLYQPNPFGTHFAEVVPKGNRAAVMYDGVEGPVFDEIIQVPLASGISVTYSRDGNRYAYVGRQADDYVVMLDGKELARVAVEVGRFGHLYFSPGGKHLCYEFAEPITNRGGSRDMVAVDGKSWPTAHSRAAEGYASWVVTIPKVIFSRDDQHYALTTVKPGSNDSRDGVTMIVDGKDAGYFGEGPQFTAQNQVLSFASTLVPVQQTLLLDGKPVRKGEVNTAFSRPIFDPTGSRYVLITQGAAFIDDKPVPNAEGINGATFVWSPDGKHYAFQGQTAGLRQYVVVDGKKDRDYEVVTGLTFSHDSTKAMYCAKAGPNWYLVINGEESAPHYTGILVVQNKQGTRVAYVLGNTLVVDGKALPVKNVQALEFSPDGAHYAFVAGSVAEGGALVVDGVEQAGFKVMALVYKEPVLTASGWNLSGDPRRFVFSPDGKHIACVGFQKKRQGLFVDGQYIPGKSIEVGRVYFTPDSQHLVWTERIKDQHHIYMDGHDVAQLDKSMASMIFDLVPGLWAMGNDGAFLVTGLQGDTVKRLRITPTSDTSVATMLADAKTTVAEMDATAEAKKAKHK